VFFTKLRTYDFVCPCCTSRSCQEMSWIGHRFLVHQHVFLWLFTFLVFVNHPLSEKSLWIFIFYFCLALNIWWFSSLLFVVPDEWYFLANILTLRRRTTYIYVALWRSLTLRRLMSYIYGAPILDVSRSHTTTQHSR